MEHRSYNRVYCDKICVYDEQPIAGQDIQYQAPDSQSRYTAPFDEDNYSQAFSDSLYLTIAFFSQHIPQFLKSP